MKNNQSWFLGVMLSATSVSISVQALKEMNQLKTHWGKIFEFIITHL